MKNRRIHPEINRPPEPIKIQWLAALAYTMTMVSLGWFIAYSIKTAYDTGVFTL